MLKCRSFMSKFNLVSGKMEWCLLDEQYDYKCEIQSSGYADMLNDVDRNSKYYNALQKIITQMKMQGKRVHVLDIGCGSGILSMMALKLGADKVTACESFEPMYRCAKRVIRDNGLLTEKIDVIHSSSMNLQIGVNMSEKANILVSEIFDSELIGEGVLPVFEHAINNLLTDDVSVIPHCARLFVQPVFSRLLQDHDYLKETKYMSRFPQSFHDCEGYSSGYDMHASSLVSDTSFNVLAPPTLVKIINFDEIGSIGNEWTIDFPNNADTFVFWWQLAMGATDEDNISTAPRWTFDRATDYKWRDHWLQMILYPPRDKVVGARGMLCQDLHSIWIDVDNCRGRPHCTCGLHTHIPRSRLCQLNSGEYAKYVDYIAKVAEAANVRTCAVISDFSYLPLSLAASGISTYNVIEHDVVLQLSQSFFGESDAMFMSLDNFLDDVDNVQLDSVIGDPFFVCSLLPWDDIHFWYGLDKIRHRLISAKDNCLISPRTMTIKAMLVQFDHLHKISSPVGRIEGFVMDKFNDLIRSSDDRTRSNDDPSRSNGGDSEQLHLESKHLWEYDGRARSDVVDLFTVDLTRSVGDLVARGTLELSGSCGFHWSQVVGANALTMWTAWEVGDGLWIDNSLDRVRSDNGNILWKPFTRQAVHFLGEDLVRSDRGEFRITCVFNLEKAEFKFTIDS